MNSSTGWGEGSRIVPRRLAATIFFLACAAGPAAAADLGGTWAFRGPAQSGLWLKTLQQGDSVRFQLELQRGGPSFNSGWIEGSFQLRGNIGIFKARTDGGSCEIGFQFRQGVVELRQLGDVMGCNLGHNVRAQGMLRRTGVRPPRFSKGDPRFG